MEIALEQHLDLGDNTWYVGACLGGDCLVAMYLSSEGQRIHTIVPSAQGQLCLHWRKYFNGEIRYPPHTTTHETLLPGHAEPYRQRNELLVEKGHDLLLAFPAMREQEPRSGVTMTINIAKRAGVPVEVTTLHQMHIPVR